MYIPSPALAFVESALNQAVSLDASHQEAVNSLEGKVVKIEVLGLQSSITVFHVDGKLQLSSLYDGDVDLKLAGSPLTFARILGDKELLYSGAIEIEGDTKVARTIKELFSNLDFEWEDYLAPVFGGTVAHQIGRAHNSFVDTLSQQFKAFEQSFSEYLTVESNAVVTTDELEKFNHGVDNARDAVDRLEARINLIKKRDTD